MRARSIFALFGALAASGCSTDPVAPLSTDEVVWFGSSGSRSDVLRLPTPSEEECHVPEPPEGTIPWANDAPPLETYCAAFGVIAGEDAELQLKFAPATDVKGGAFMLLLVPETATWIDETGAPVAPGQMVRVTVAVHPTLYALRFGPHGSGFRNKQSAALKLNYSWADLGKRDAKDLVIYYQADEGGTWEAELTVVDKKGNFVWTWLNHFSNYAVAW